MKEYPVIAPKKLIEVALPLDAINASCGDEKNPFLKKHPRNIHQWWARRPLAAARAVLFGQLVNDPSWKWEIEHPGEIPPSHLKASWAAGRKRLFSIIKELVLWENTTNEEVLEKARAEIRKSWRETCEINKEHPQSYELFNPDTLPAVHDPFAGGGAIPLEAQRLGLEAYASDLNPVAVLINKAMIEIPPLFSGHKPIGPLPKSEAQMTMLNQWPGTTGLAEDIRRYGAWVSDEAVRRIGHYYPNVEITREMASSQTALRNMEGKKLKVFAWLWARTVKSPNPAFHHIEVPLVSSFVLSSKIGKEVYLEPQIVGDCYSFIIKNGIPPKSAYSGTKYNQANFLCIMSKSPIDAKYIQAEALAGRMKSKLIAIVVESPEGKIYIEPVPKHEISENDIAPQWKPDIQFFQQALGFRVGNYGMTKWSDLFTSRQLLAMTTLCDLVNEVRDIIQKDAEQSKIFDDSYSIDSGGTGARAYSEAISVYLATAISQLIRYSCSLCVWNKENGNVGQVFKRQALSMVWDFAEINPLLGNLNYNMAVGWVTDGLQSANKRVQGYSTAAAAQTQSITLGKVVSTDPPYYDNIGYADLSDFFYVWLRHSLRSVYPSLFATITSPKNEELVATPSRHGGKKNAEEYFITGMKQAILSIAKQANKAVPITIYYAFKQSETTASGGTRLTGWETFLEAVYNAGLVVTGTWPIRTERAARPRDQGSNALSSSIILVCRPRLVSALTISRRQFIRELNQVLPEALDEMTKGAGDQQSPVAPVDLSQAIIGPGMAVFSKYSAVLEADGAPMTVHTALQLINRFLAEGDFDADTQFCLHWFEQYGWKEGKFGDADTLARAKGTSVDGVKSSGVLYAAGGVVRLLKWPEYPEAWTPSRDQRLPVWEVLHQLIRVFKYAGETAAGEVYAAVQSKAEASRQLAYRLYTLCERAGWAEDARAYNEIITSWNAIETAAANTKGQLEAGLFDE